MWKKVRLLLLVVTALGLVAVVFSWQLNFLNLPLRIALEDIARQPVTFREIDYRFFNRITIEDLTIGRNFRCRRMIIYLNPWTLLRHFNAPESALSRIHFTRPWIDINNEFIGQLGRMKLNAPGGNGSGLKISWDNAELANRIAPVSRLNGQIVLSSAMTGSMSGEAGGNHLAVHLSQDAVGGGIRGTASARMKGPATDIEMAASWDRTSGETIAVSLNIPRAQWRGMMLMNSSGTVTWAKSGFAAEIAGRDGTITVAGADPSHYRARAYLQLSGLTGAATGALTLTAEKQGDDLNGFLQTSDLSMNDMYLGNLRLSFQHRGGEMWSCGGTLEPAHYSFNALLKNGKELEVYLQAGRKGFGKVLGRISPLNMDVKLANWPVENLPVPRARYPELKGVMNLNGKIAGKTGKFSAMVSGLKIRGSKPVSFIVRMLVKSGDLFYQAESVRRDWRISGKNLTGGKWELQGALDRLALQDYLSWLQTDIPLGMCLTGSIRYSSERSGEAHLSASDIAWDRETIGSGKLNLMLTPEALDVKEFALHSGKGTLTCRGEIGIRPKKDECRLQFVFFRFPFKGTLLQGPLSIAGRWTGDGMTAFSGNVTSSSAKINRWSTGRLKADLDVSGKRLEVRNLVWDPLLSGDVALRFDTGALNGKLAVRELSLADIHPALSGHVSGEALLAGAIDSPRVTVHYRVPDTRYRDVSFRQSGTAHLSNGEVYLEQVRLASEMGAADVSGKLWPDLKMTGAIDSVSSKLLRAIGAFSPPLAGAFSGPFRIEGPVKAPVVSLEASGKNVAIAGMPLSECRCQVNYRQGIITIDGMTAHFNDSELRILPESRIDLNARKFGVKSEWRNVHLGGIDCFGFLQLSGDWKGGNNAQVNCLAGADNFWVNQYNIEGMRIGAQYRDGVVSFQQLDKQPVTVTGSVDVRAWPQLKFDHLSVAANDGGSVTIDGDIGDREWQFSVAGKDIASSAIMEMLDQPVAMDGNMAVSIVGRGSPEHPILEGNLSCTNGTIGGVPYDSIGLQLSVRQNVLTLTRARAMKKDQYAIVATGYCPFFLTEAGKKEVQKNPIDLTVSIEEGSLNLLSAATDDIKSARGGLRAQARVTGTLAKPVTNGYFRVTNGAINSRRYFNRLSELNIDLVWKDNLLTVREFSGKVGEGMIAAAGTVRFNGFAPDEYNLSCETQGKRGVPVSIPELPIPTPLLKTEEWDIFSNLSHGEPRFALTFSGSGEKPVLGGWIDLENTRFTYPSLARPGEGESILDPLFQKLLLDLEIRSGKNTWYENELCSVNIMGGIRLNGKWFSPSVSGRVDSVRGTVSYIGTEFRIKQASVEIVKDRALLEAEAETEVYGKTPGDTDIIQMFIDKADIERIKPRFVSKNSPTMTPEKALAKATGIDPEVYSQTDQEYLLRQQMIRLVDSTLTTPLARNLLRKSGIADSFRVQYLSQEPIKPANPANPTLTELLYGTKYSLEKYLTDRMLFGYSVTFDQIQNRLDLRHELELSFRWQKNTFLKGIYELETNNPVRQHDRRIMVEQQFRFGWPWKNTKKAR